MTVEQQTAPAAENGDWALREDAKQYDLEQRTYRFARDIRALIKGLPRTLANIEDARQLVNSSGSVASNYIEANEALSKKDFHHCETDERGLLTRANLIVTTQNNAARIALSVDQAARGLIQKGVVNDGLLNRIEMAFRAYDPCFGCATHADGHVPFRVNIYDHQHELAKQLVYL